ncbi:unnamed protein product [Dimorphilus gyrociliatus]|uniref:Mediator of RNA polymerase II transcription subunit 7 n=1 Tax=Dimorphilus gyrociliatus TaxID=2664684 RepID=A0A7I8VJA2_9ANNE|nr:unnamed protein product [Dimorphilus gyrociliatus]
MAVNQQQQAVSALPLPPIFYQGYTNENIEKGRAPQPPRPPKPYEPYSCFGFNYGGPNDGQIVPPLETQNVKRLHPQNYEHRRELIKMNHSLLCAVLDLLQILVTSADSPQRTQKLSDIYLILIHMQHLINELRPVQARDALAAMMQRQVKATREAVLSITRVMNKAANFVNKAICNVNVTSATNSIYPTFIKTEVEEEKKPSIITDESELKNELMCSIIDNLDREGLL